MEPRYHLRMLHSILMITWQRIDLCRLRCSLNGWHTLSLWHTRHCSLCCSQTHFCLHSLWCPTHSSTNNCFASDQRLPMYPIHLTPDICWICLSWSWKSLLNHSLTICLVHWLQARHQEGFLLIKASFRAPSPIRWIHSCCVHRWLGPISRVQGYRI